MAFILGVISNRPGLLQQNLPAYAAMLKGRKGWRIVVCDDETTFAENKPFLEKLAVEHGLEVRHLSNKTGSRVSQALENELGRDVSRLFQNNFGGLRNLILLSSAALGSGTVFVDDDTTPLYDFFDRYERRFADGWKLVPGGYEGHVNLTSPALLYLVGETMNELRAGLVSKADAAFRVSSALMGLPPKKASFTKNMFAGGNLGISLELVSAYPFLPTGFRVEDAVYKMAVDCFFKEDKLAVFKARGYQEAYALTPLSQHERAPSAKPSLCSQLLNELRGAIAAKLIDSVGFESFKKETVVTDAEIESILAEALDLAWSEFNMENHKASLAEAVALLSGDEKAEAERIASFGKADAALRLEDAKRTLDDFSFCLKAWPYVTGALADEKVRNQVLEALGVEQQY